MHARQQAARISKLIICAMQTLHKLHSCVQLANLDISLGNVMLVAETANEWDKLRLDFGLAELFQPGNTSVHHLSRNAECVLSMHVAATLVLTCCHHIAQRLGTAAVFELS